MRIIGTTRHLIMPAGLAAFMQPDAIRPPLPVVVVHRSEDGAAMITAVTGPSEAIRDVEAIRRGRLAMLNPVDRVDPLTGAKILVSILRVSLFWLGQRSVNAAAPLTGR